MPTPTSPPTPFLSSAPSRPPDALEEATETPPRLFPPAFIALLCIHPFLGFTFSSFVLLPKMLATTHGAGPALIGQVTAAASLAAALAAFAGGPLIDRWGRKPLFVAGAALEALSSFAFPWVHEVGPALFALRAIQGVAFATAFNAGCAMVVDIVPKARAGQALGLLGLSGLVTNAIAPAIGEPLAHHFGWNPVFLLAAASSAASCVAGAIFLREPPMAKAEAGPAPPFRHPLDIYSVSVLVGLGSGAMFNFTQPFALLRGIPDVSSLFVGYTISAVFVRGVFGGLPDKLGRRRVAAAAQILYGLTVVLAAGLRPGWLFPLGFLLGLAHGIAYPTLAAVSVENVPRLGRGIVMALYYGAYNLGVTIGQLAFGPIVERVGYPLSFVVMGALVLTGVPLLVRRAPAPALRSEVEA